MSTLLYEVQVTKDAFERFQEKTENGWQVGCGSFWLLSTTGLPTGPTAQQNCPWCFIASEWGEELWLSKDLVQSPKTPEADWTKPPSSFRSQSSRVPGSKLLTNSLWCSPGAWPTTRHGKTLHIGDQEQSMSYTRYLFQVCIGVCSSRSLMEFPLKSKSFALWEYGVEWRTLALGLSSLSSVHGYSQCCRFLPCHSLRGENVHHISMFTFHCVL